MTTRKDDIKTERRRRNSDGMVGKRRHLMVDESKIDRENFAYRFANDEGNRIHDLTVNDDWDVVTDGVTADNHAMGAGTRKRVGTGEGGSPVNAVLLRKPKAYHDADQAAKQRRIDASEEALREPAGEGNYQPASGGISISRGS